MAAPARAVAARGGGRNGGQAALHAAMARSGESQREVARRVGVSQPLVSGWLSGAYRPHVHARLALQREYEIPLTSWDYPATRGDGGGV